VSIVDVSSLRSLFVCYDDSVSVNKRVTDKRKIHAKRFSIFTHLLFPFTTTMSIIISVL